MERYEKKRILSLFLALAMTAPMLPVMAKDENDKAAAEKTVTEMTEEFPVIAEEDAQQPAEGEDLPENGKISENEEQKEMTNPFEDLLPRFEFEKNDEQTETEDGTEDEIALMAAEDFAWELSEDGTLTISGNGAMPNWNSTYG